MFINGTHVCFLNFVSKREKKTDKEIFSIDFSTTDGIHYSVIMKSKEELEKLQSYIESDDPDNPSKEFGCTFVDGKQFMVSHFSY